MGEKITFLFSGQGSQYYRMGYELYNTLPMFRQNVDRLDSIYKDKTGRSLVSAIFDGGHSIASKFDNILYTHPALFVVQYSLAVCLANRGILPTRVLGASLGECVSLVVAGVLTPEDMLEVLIRQAVLFDRECVPGGMIAILRDPEFYRDNPEIFQGCDMAALNIKALFCVAADEKSLDATEAHLKFLNITHERLPVRQPFHSSILDDLRGRFLQTFEGVRFNQSSIEVISSMATNVPDPFDPEYMWNVIRSPILFYDTIKQLSWDEEMIYVDVGPSGTLANFVKYNLPKQGYDRLFTIMTPFGDDLANYNKLINELCQPVALEGVC